MDLGAGWVSRRGKGKAILARVDFFLQKSSFVGNKNWGLFSFGPNFHVLGSLYWFMIHNPYIAG